MQQKIRLEEQSYLEYSLEPKAMKKNNTHVPFLRKYGICVSVVRELQQLLCSTAADSRLIVIHLGTVTYPNQSPLKIRIWCLSKLLFNSNPVNIQWLTIAIIFELIYYIDGYFRAWLTSMNIDPKCHINQIFMG